MSELIPCPWCKTNEGAALGYIGQPAVAWSVSCICCGAEGPRGDTPSEAMRLWSTRPAAQAVAVDDVRIPKVMDRNNIALIERYGVDYLDGWNDAVEALQAAMGGG